MMDEGEERTAFAKLIPASFDDQRIKNTWAHLKKMQKRGAFKL